MNNALFFKTPSDSFEIPDIAQFGITRSWAMHTVSNATVDYCLRIQRGDNGSEIRYVFYDSIGKVSLDSPTNTTTNKNASGTKTFAQFISDYGNSTGFKVLDWYCSITGFNITRISASTIGMIVNAGETILNREQGLVAINMDGSGAYKTSATLFEVSNDRDWTTITFTSGSNGVSFGTTISNSFFRLQLSINVNGCSWFFKNTSGVNHTNEISSPSSSDLLKMVANTFEYNVESNLYLNGIAGTPTPITGNFSGSGNIVGATRLETGIFNGNYLGHFVSNRVMTDQENEDFYNTIKSSLGLN